MMFFFKQKTAYEMLISDWSSDVCSSDLIARASPMLQHLNVKVSTVGAHVTRRQSLMSVYCVALRCAALRCVAFQGNRISDVALFALAEHCTRSEERRVGKERVSLCRFRLSPCHYTKNIL